MPENQTDSNEGKKTFSEQFEVAGHQLVSKVKELVAQGNVRRLIFRAPDDTVMMEMTLTTGAVIGGVITLTAWWVAAIGAVAALLTRVRIEVVREIQDTVEPEEAAESPPSPPTKQKVRVEIEDDE